MAEVHGFDVVSVFADLLYGAPLPALLEMAATTSRVRLDAACGGRAYLGLARGTWLDAIGIDQRRPLAHLRDTAAIVRALLSGEIADEIKVGGSANPAIVAFDPGPGWPGPRWPSTWPW